MAKKVKWYNYLKFFLFSIFVSIVLTLIIGLLFGYKYILVNGWSAQQEIPYQSLIVTYKCKKNDLKVNDFATTSANGSGSYITHQVIGVKYEGYFEAGECFSWEMNGDVFHAYYGYQVAGDHNVTAKPGPIPDEATQIRERRNMTIASDLREDCNIITMANSEDGNTTKEYRNFETEFVGKVIWHNYTLGKTLFILKDSAFLNRLLLLGIITSVILVVVMSNQSKLEIGFYD